MTKGLKIFLILFLIFQIYLIIKTVKIKKLSMKYCGLWLIIIIGFMIITIFPSIAFKLSEFFKFEKASNMVFLLGFFLLFYLNFILTISLSNQNNKIKKLIQEVSLLKESEKKDGKQD